jgi:hypothetical protein
MFGLQEIIRVNQLAVERPKGNTRDRLDKFIGLINCLKHPGLIRQCSRCSNYTVCLEIASPLTTNRPAHCSGVLPAPGQKPAG